MSKKMSSLRFIIAFGIIFSTSLFVVRAHLYGAIADSKTHLEGSSDGIVIDLPSLPEDEPMPGVMFFHDQHTDALKGEKNPCAVCHMKDEETDRFVFKYERLDDGDIKRDMAIYHENCIACHVDRKMSGLTSGPREGQCRACHAGKKIENSLSTWRPIPFDKSLHYRHERSKSIKSPFKEDEGNCRVCHHGFDDKEMKIRYSKGEEQSCRYCHLTGVEKRNVSLIGEDGQNGMSSLTGEEIFLLGKKERLSGKMESDSRKNEVQMRAPALGQASHNACINCHLVEMKNFAGPVDCRGCHDPEEQEKISRIEDVPRMKRGQPDRVMMSGWDTAQISSLEALDKAVAEHMDPVAFNHEIHEKGTTDCRSCHHETLKSCRTCHTVQGEKKGGNINLSGAMHDPATEQSCIGCHNQKKKEQDCAGCHAQIPQQSFASDEKTCLVCHGMDLSGTIESLKVSQAGEGNEDQVKAFVASMDTMLKKSVESRQTVENEEAFENVPEKVRIDVLSDAYEASEFPHGKIIRSLKKRVSKSRLATVFHGEDTTLCMGCHHNSPATEKPQKCGSCHGKTGLMTTDGRPALKGAYHGQCITCHQEMNIESVAATDCNKCHKEKK